MIILDTNVVSEPLKAHASAAVQSWLDRQIRSEFYFTSTSLAELLVGIELLPRGQRRTQLETFLEAFILRLFAGRILAFDHQAARAYASILSRTRTSGITISVGDGQIAAIAFVHGFAVATRDTKPFLGAGLRVINPWQN